MDFYLTGHMIENKPFYDQNPSWLPLNTEAPVFQLSPCDMTETWSGSVLNREGKYQIYHPLKPNTSVPIVKCAKTIILVFQGIKAISHSYELIVLHLMSSTVLPCCPFHLSFFIINMLSLSCMTLINTSSNEPVNPQKQLSVHICVWFHKINLLPS